MEDAIFLRPGVIYKLQINPLVSIDIINSNGSLHLVHAGGIDIDLVEILELDKEMLVVVKDIPRAKFEPVTGSLVTDLPCVPTFVARSFGELYSEKNDEAKKLDFKKNIDTFASFTEEGDYEAPVNELELHTHFMEVLSGEQFYNLVKNRITFIDFDEEGEMVTRYPYNPERPSEIARGYRKYSIEEIEKNSLLRQKVIENLSITPFRQVDFKEISRVLHRRQALIELVAYHETATQVDVIADTKKGNWKQQIADVRAGARRNFYFDMLIASLDYLKSMGVKYVEFSYSTAETITTMYDKMMHTLDINGSGIDFNFLYSVHRTKTLKDYVVNAPDADKKSMRSCVQAVLPFLIERGLVKGFDLMGMENEISLADMVPGVDSNGSLYDKILAVLGILYKYPKKDLVFRLHAGEIPYDESIDLESIMGERNTNPEKTMIIIDSICTKYNLTIPPPHIRLGHGLHFKKSDNYLKLLKDYKVIIEINGSSNLALRNITDLSQIPYNWYLENGVPVVISTDGGGFYLTTPVDEMMLAKIYGGKNVPDQVMHTTNDYKKHLGRM